MGAERERMRAAVPSIGDALRARPAGRTAAMSRPACSRAVRPGLWFPLGATLRDGGTNFAVASGIGRRDAAVPVRRAGRGDPDPAAGSRRRRVARVRARRRRRAGVRIPRDRAVRPGPRSPLQPGQAAAGPVRQGDHRRGPVRAGGARPRRPTTPTRRAPSTRPPTCRAAWWWTRPTSGRPSPAPPRRYADTVVYEVHVKGFTATHPDVPPELRGTYAGLGHAAAIAHLLDSA